MHMQIADGGVRGSSIASEDVAKGQCVSFIQTTEYLTKYLNKPRKALVSICLLLPHGDSHSV
jgi:hypothetical protein